MPFLFLAVLVLNVCFKMRSYNVSLLPRFTGETDGTCVSFFFNITVTAFLSGGSFYWYTMGMYQVAYYSFCDIVIVFVFWCLLCFYTAFFHLYVKVKGAKLLHVSWVLLLISKPQSETQYDNPMKYGIFISYILGDMMYYG